MRAAVLWYTKNMKKENSHGTKRLLEKILQACSGVSIILFVVAALGIFFSTTHEGGYALLLVGSLPFGVYPLFRNLIKFGTWKRPSTPTEWIERKMHWALFFITLFIVLTFFILAMLGLSGLR